MYHETPMLFVSYYYKSCGGYNCGFGQAVLESAPPACWDDIAKCCAKIAESMEGQGSQKPLVTIVNWKEM